MSQANRSRADSAAGVVALTRLLELYGPHHRVELEALWAAPGTEHLVLFADVSGGASAILAVGPAHPCRSLDAALETEIEGLRAICHTPALRAAEALRDGGLSAEDLALIAGVCHESAESLSEAISEGVRAGLHPVRAAFSHLAHFARDLARREKFVVESENKLGDRAQALAELQAELEQREADLANRTKAAERAGRLPFEREPAGFRAPAMRVPSVFEPV